MSNYVLVINTGSSSLKAAVLDAVTEEVPFEATLDKLGSKEQSSFYRLYEKEKTDSFQGSLPDAIAAIVRLVKSEFTLPAVAHRVVHGGDTFQEATLLTQENLSALESISHLAPLHNPVNVVGIYSAMEALPDMPQVAVFDTAFHATMPPLAYRYAVPESWYQDYSVRRFGFHGTSHQYVTQKAAEYLQKSVESLQFVSIHLGNGCSLCAVKNGQSVDTSMGMTPLEGLMMGTRSGDIDPGALCYLVNQKGFSMETVDYELNHESGLLGVSGVSNDMRTLSEHAKKGNERAKLAIELFCYRVAKSIAAISVALDRLDGLIFTGGIGENAAFVRQKITDYLHGLSVRLDKEKNRQHETIISESNSTDVLVIKTNEALMIAQEALVCIKDQP